MHHLLLILALASTPSIADPGAGNELQVHVRGEHRFSVGPAPSFVEQVSVPESWPDGRTDETWRYWLVDSQEDRRGGRHLAYRDMAYEATTPAGVRSAARVELGFSPEFQTLTLHRVAVRRDGRWQDRLDPTKVSLARREERFEEDLADGQVSALLVLEDVQVGDVVRVTYTVDGSNPVMAGLTAHGFTLGWGSPARLHTGRVLFDPGTDVDVRVDRHPLRVKPARRADAVEVAFRIDDQAAVQDPGDTPAWFDPYPRLQVAPRKAWSDIVEWALPLYPDDAPLPPELAARLDALPDGSIAARVAAALRIAQEEVRYFGIEIGDNTHRPHAPEVVWARRYGDCKDKAHLLVRMLSHLGVEARPALVSTARGKGIAQRLPAASAFDHVIVQARVEGRDYWLDPTITGQRGSLDSLDLPPYGMALPVAPGSGELVEVVAPASAAHGVEYAERFTANADGKRVRLSVETRYRGLHADRTRRRLQSERLDEIADAYLDYYRKLYGSAEAASKMSMEEDEGRNEIVLRQDYDLADVLTPDGQSRTLSSYAEALSVAARLPRRVERDAPISLDRRSTLRHVVRLDLPEGWRSGTLPGALNISGGPAHYSRQIDVNDGRVELQHELRLDADHVPASDARAYADGMRRIRDALGLRISMQPPAPSKDSERERRLRDLLRGAIENQGE